MSFMRSTRAEFAKDWPVVPFEEAIEDATGGNAKVQTRDYRESGRLPVIDQGQSAIAGYVDDIALACRAPLPCILFGDHTRTLKYVTTPFALGADGVKVLVPQKELDARFVYHYLQTVRLPDDLGYSRHFKYLRESVVPMPPLAEQRRIADILDKADAIRRKRKEAIALTEELLRSAFLEMFGDPVTNPKGWRVKPLGQLLANDPRIGTLVPASDKPGTLVVRVGELGAYDVDLSRSKRASLSDGEFERFGLETGDVLLARAIGSEDHLGKSSVLQPYSEPVAFDSHVMRLRFRDEFLDPYVFVQWLRTPGGRARFMNEAGRTAVQFNVNGKQIVKVQIPLPPRSEQRRFRRLFDSVRAMDRRSGAGLRESEHLFNSLVARAFAGEFS